MNTPNLLIHESSPYLLQHAHNPVNWHAWNKDTLAKARELKKPLLISIGYSTCHWCHVMEKETFEDASVAEMMNEHFVCVKVDREEHPEVDQIYMDAIQMLTGSGGWPLNCFALPDGKPFYGGTYFRKEEWKDIISRIGELYRTNPKELEKYAAEVMQGLSSAERPLQQSNQSIRKEDVEMFTDKITEAIDREKGGLQGAPKFPLPQVIASELAAAILYHNKTLHHHALLTLEKMASGGIYDQIGGGFARYATDEEWKVPHFEKMLYDNAQLLAVFSKAYTLSKNDMFRKIVYETVSFLEHEFECENGGYFSALDADSEGEEGRYYVWTASEIDKALPEYSKLIKSYYGINKEGYWEDEKNILIRTQNNDTFARRNNLSETELEALLKTTKKQLLKVRETRPRPSLDDKVISSWNGLMLSGFLDAYLAFDDKWFLQKSQRLAAFLTEEMINDDGSLYRIFKEGTKKIGGFLDDYAFTAQAFLKLFQVTGSAKHLETAEKLACFAMDHLYDPHSGFFFYSQKDASLIQRKRDIHDNVMPSGNAVIMELLYELGMIYEKTEWLDISEKALQQVIPQMYRSVVAFSTWGRLLMNRFAQYFIVAVTGPDAEQAALHMLRSGRPNAVVVFSSGVSNIPVLKNRHSDSETRLFVCTERACLKPVKSVEEAISLISKKPD